MPTGGIFEGRKKKSPGEKECSSVAERETTKKEMGKKEKCLFRGQPKKTHPYVSGKDELIKDEGKRGVEGRRRNMYGGACNEKPNTGTQKPEEKKKQEEKERGRNGSGEKRGEELKIKLTTSGKTGSDKNPGQEEKLILSEEVFG